MGNQCQHQAKNLLQFEAHIESANQISKAFFALLPAAQFIFRFEIVNNDSQRTNSNNSRAHNEGNATQQSQRRRSSGGTNNRWKKHVTVRVQKIKSQQQQQQQQQQQCASNTNDTAEEGNAPAAVVELYCNSWQRVLTVDKFYLVYEKMRNELTLLKMAHLSKTQKNETTAPANGVHASNTNDGAGAGVGDEKPTRVGCFGDDNKNETEECPVCMDRPADMLLVCTHAFCSECIKAWEIHDQTCPLCRGNTVGEKGEQWVIASAPTQAEVIESIESCIDAATLRH